MGTYTPKSDTDFKIDTKISRADDVKPISKHRTEGFDINAGIPSSDVSVSAKSPELKTTDKSKSKGTSCFGKPTGTDIEGEYKASTKVKGNIPEGENLKVEVPSVDASVNVEAPDLDIEMGKTPEKTKSKGTSCFGKPKGTDIDGEYKANTNIKIDTP